MQPNKVYESLAHLCDNIIKNERLRYELFDKVLFKDQFVRQINNMLALEKDFDQELYGEKWATIFAKALVKIVDKKQRFEKPEGRSTEEIYADYSAFLSYTVTTFAINRTILVDDAIKFTQEDVIFNAKLSESVKEQFKALEAEKLQAENEQTNSKTNAQQSNANSNESPYNNQNKFNNNPNQDFFNQQGFNAMPVHPMQDPRFYPYNSKPKWMQVMRWILAAVTITTAIMLIVASAFMMSTKMNFNNTIYGDALFGNNGGETPWDPANGGNWSVFVKEDYEFPFNISFLGVNVQTIFGFFFYSLPAIYIAYNAFKKPRNLKEKYRVNPWPVFFMIILFIMGIFSIFQAVNPNQMKTGIASFIAKFLRSPDKIGPNFKYNFDGFWDEVMKNYGKEINNLTTVADVAIGLITVSIIFGVVLLIINPRLDRDKVMLANMEYQKATMAAMQGQSYEMNPSLFDDDVVEHKKSKFGQWWQKTFGQKKKKQEKD